MKKPKPVHVETVCSVCGLDWDRHHGDEPTADKCIELLRADLAKEKQRMTPALPQPYPMPYPVPYRPWVNPYPGIANPFPLNPRPLWTISGTSDATGVTGGNITLGAINASSVSH